MGLTYVTLKIRKHKEADHVVEGEFLVDSGAIFTVAPTDLLNQLDVEADGEETFTLANGEKVTRKVGDAYFEMQGKGGYAKVVFGEEGDSNLLGAMTLEACGLILDPIKRELKPLPMVMM